MSKRPRCCSPSRRPLCRTGTMAAPPATSTGADRPHPRPASGPERNRRVPNQAEATSRRGVRIGPSTGRRCDPSGRRGAIVGLLTIHDRPVILRGCSHAASEPRFRGLADEQGVARHPPAWGPAGRVASAPHSAAPRWGIAGRGRAVAAGQPRRRFLSIQPSLCARGPVVPPRCPAGVPGRDGLSVREMPTSDLVALPPQAQDGQDRRTDRSTLR